MADLTIAVSHSLGAELITRYPSSADISVIPNGILPAELKGRDELRRLGVTDRQYLLYVGRLVPEKGIQVLIEASRRVPDVEFVVAGAPRYTDAYSAALTARADHNVRFLGATYDTTLAALYTHAHAVVVPSLHEGSGLTAMEALSYGKPVLASDIPALRESLGSAGLYYPPGDIDGLVAAIRRVLDDSRLVTEKRVLARQQVRELYDWDQVALLSEQALLAVCS
jgi:glycosyltransferase involved in cell wall biosynthesis